MRNEITSRSFRILSMLELKKVDVEQQQSKYDSSIGYCIDGVQHIE